jgi:GAF domain-containing protein
MPSAGADRRGESRILREIISTVSSSLELEEVLRSVVRLLTDAAGVHACFVYLVEEGGERLVLRAASEPYAHLVDRIELERPQGLAWWVIEHREPSFIRENAPADPRFRFVGELEEERFQSLISAPIPSRGGAPIGAITMHTEAPREFSEEEVQVLVSTAALVAGAIENARLYEESRRRVSELERLTELGETVARAETPEALLPAVATGARELLGAAACRVYLLDEASEELRVHAASPPEAAAQPAIALSRLGQELTRRRGERAVTVPLVAGDELVGLLEAEGTGETELARAVANQTALALKRLDLIERLTEKNLIKDFFEELAGGTAATRSDGRAARLGFDADAAYLVILASPPDDELERDLAGLAPGSLFDRRDDVLRGLLRIPRAGEAALVDALRESARGRTSPVAAGVSNPCRGLASFPPGFEEARHALLGTTVLGREPGVMTYEELGPYKYLLRMSLEGAGRDRYREAVAQLAEYDRRRSTNLLPTLEEFLRRRGSIGATADALYVHPNTLRQRLRRVETVSGIDLRRDDWLVVEIAVKMARLEDALSSSR